MDYKLIFYVRNKTFFAKGKYGAWISGYKVNNDIL